MMNGMAKDLEAVESWVSKKGILFSLQDAFSDKTLTEPLDRALTQFVHLVRIVAADCDTGTAFTKNDVAECMFDHLRRHRPSHSLTLLQYRWKDTVPYIRRFNDPSTTQQAKNKLKPMLIKRGFLQKK